MDVDIYSCPSISAQTLEIDDSEGLEYKEDMRTPPMPIRLRPGGFRPDTPVSFRSRDLAASSSHTRGPP
jgi:hypothetical protein